jgi:uncharacterized protein GlcG (DUF336 family)
LVAACKTVAQKNNSAVVVVVLDAQGLPVLVSRGDGEGLVQIRATEQKTLTALRTRAPSHALTNRNAQDSFTSQNMAGYGLTTQKGGLPIIVNGQLIGAMGAGGMGTANAEENCVRDALEQVIGPQPPLLPDLPARPVNAPAGGRG